jgi:alpha-amylase
MYICRDSHITLTNPFIADKYIHPTVIWKQSDFFLRVEAQYPSSIENEELNSLLETIQNQGREIEQLEKKLAKYESKISSV